MKIVTVIGARPQFVKAAAVSRAIAEHNRSGLLPTIHELIVHTGQHFDENMSEIFFTEMEIPQPDYRLEVNSLGHGAMTGRMLEKIEEVLLKEQPDWLLVYGDTNSTIAGALAAKKLHIRVAHVEAGLRSFNMRMPEEINRILTDRISDLLFCPTDTAVKNLQNEGFNHHPSPITSAQSPTNHNPRIIKTGDVMQDAALFYRDKAADKSTIIEKLGLKDQLFALCTIHRAENTDDPERLRNIIEALEEISRELHIVLPLHPRTRKKLQDAGLPLHNSRSTIRDSQLAIHDPRPTIHLLDPVGYFDMIQLLENTKIVLTDSGGLQKEAFFFCKPCVTLRDETEWVELVEGGYNMLAGAVKELIYKGFHLMLAAKPDFSKDLYGLGSASKAIVNEIVVAAQ